LTSWKGTVVRKQDIFVAKNYLNKVELDTLNRLVTVFLESAELRAKNRQDITMSFWKESVDRILVFNDFTVLDGPGTVSHTQMEGKVGEIYASFDARRKIEEAQEADRLDLEALEKSLKKSKK
jgi:hypothetical protein